MDLLELTFYGNTVRAWAIAVIVAALALGALMSVRWLLVGHLTRSAGETATGLDDLIIAVLSKTRLLFLVVVAIFVGSRFISLEPSVSNTIGRLTVIVLLLQAGAWGTAAIRFGIEQYQERQLEKDAAAVTTMRFLGFVGRVALWTLIALVILDNLGVDITILAAGVSVGGIAVALAVQNVLGDLMASLSIVFDKPFVIGDFIIVGDLMGTVENVGLKTTRVRSLSGEQLVFSNTDLLNSRIRNFKRMFERRMLFSFGVVYQTPYEKLRAIPGTVREIIEAQEQARFDRAHFKAYGDSSLDFEVVYYVTVPEYNIAMDTQQAINLELYRRFEAEGIEFAYPTRTLYMPREIGEPAPAAAAEEPRSARRRRAE